MPDWKKLAKGKAGDNGDASGQSPPEKSLEESCREEIGEAEQAFRARLDREDTRKLAVTDSEFWFAVYFPSRAEKEDFLRKYGLDRVGDKYLSGKACDRVLQGRIGSKDVHKRRGHS